METKLQRIAETARTKPNEKFTSLIHLINEDTLKTCHREMDKGKAAGVDDMTKEEYDFNLDANVKDLVGRMKRQAYKPQSVKRVYIPKVGTDKMRPLGIPAYEDKLVQGVLAKILNAVYEQDFLECSFGFRPKRSCHDALKVLNKVLDKKEINYVVDADIKGFFDHVDHECLKQFVQHRIADPNIVRLIVRFLKAGVVEEGIEYDTLEGTPQGGVVSPILANIYLHYVLDLWFDKAVRKAIKGSAYMVRYADDSVFCFQYEEDAKNFYSNLILRLKKFNLEIAEEKTKIVCLGKDKDDNNKNAGGDTSFDFLGFTHYMGKNKTGMKCIKLKTSKKKYKVGLLKLKEWIKWNRNMPIKQLMKELVVKLNGHCRYYGVTYNRQAESDFLDEVKRRLFKWLNRRSQRKSFNWSSFNLFLQKYPLPKAKIYVRIFDLGAGKSYVL